MGSSSCSSRLLYSPKERGEVLFILKKGHVQLYRMSDEGRKLVITTLGPGTIFGEMALTGLGMHDAFAEATEEALICILNRGDLEKLLISKPKIAVRLLNVMAKRLQETEERLEQTLFHDVPSQLAALLLRLRNENHSDVVEMTHEELAEHLGVYRETVTAVLNNLRKDDLISIGRSRASGVVNFVEGNTHASGPEDPLCCRHWVMRFWVVNDKATVRFERSLLGRSSLPR